jgi:hypothetical protein
MKNFTSEKRATWQLKIDDWIKIGSVLYRIKDIQLGYLNPTDKMSLTLQPNDGDPLATVIMLAPRSAIFKVYNQ